MSENDEQVYVIQTIGRNDERTYAAGRHRGAWSEKELCDLWRHLESLLFPFVESDGALKHDYTLVDGQFELLVTVGDKLTAWTSRLPIKLSLLKAAQRRLWLQDIPSAGNA